MDSELESKTYKPEGFFPLDKQTIYVSGPMRGYDDLNSAAFNAVADLLHRYGAFAHNPCHKVNTGEHDSATPYHVAIREDIEMLLDSTAICLLPGWRESEGARFEAEIARSLGLSFYEAYYLEHGLSEIADGGWKYKPVDAPVIGVEGIDQEARRLVYGQRAATYGHPRGDFDTIGMLWAGILQSRAEAISRGDAGWWARLKQRATGRAAWADLLSPEVVALCMSALKLARLASTPDHRDSQVDTIGYMLCLARIQEDPTEMSAWDAQYRRGNDLADS